MMNRRRHLLCGLSLVAAMAAACIDESPNAGAADVEGDCWYCIDSAATADADAAAASEATPSKDVYGGKDFISGKDVDAKDPGGKDFGGVWVGELLKSTGLGTTSYEVSDADKATLCKVSYPVSNATALDTCSQCEFAWALTLGEPTVEGEIATCSAGAGLAGTVVSYGHVPDDLKGGLLYTHKGGAWVATYGASNVSGDDWTFYILTDGAGGK